MDPDDVERAAETAASMLRAGRKRLIRSLARSYVALTEGGKQIAADAREAAREAVEEVAKERQAAQERAEAEYYADAEPPKVRQRKPRTPRNTEVDPTELKPPRRRRSPSATKPPEESG